MGLKHEIKMCSIDSFNVIIEVNKKRVFFVIFFQKQNIIEES